ncbi:MAG TPA: RDD family protein, partial [Dongiaceae bacterium]|nr:RDD family protein [Dongiaceae bacterium]
GLLRGSSAGLELQTTFDLMDFLGRSPWQALPITLVSLVFVMLYYAVLEGRWGVTLGKLAFGLRVVGPDNSPPGFLRALPRPLLYAVAPALPYWLVWINAKAYLTASTTFQICMGFSFYLLLALLFSTARRRNGFAAVHDLLTKTRVISRAALQGRPAPALAPTSPPAVEAKPLIGPYHVLDALEDSPGTAWLLGYDIRLLRKVWIRTVPAGTPPVPCPLRNLGRVGRLRWLAGRRSPEENWDAFEALTGQPLLRLLGQKPQPGQGAGLASVPQPWAQVRYWLCDLATELSAAQKDNTLPPLLDLSRVWVTGDGRVKLLDFPAPGTPAPAADASPPAPPMVNNADAPRFLGRVAAAALEGRADAAAQAPSEIPVALPLHVRKFFKALPQLSDANTLLLALRPLLQRIAVVTRSRRAAVAAAGIAFPLFIACLSLFGPALLDQWNRRHPGVFELSQLLQQHSSMRRWAKNQPGPTDRQYAIYIAQHYRGAITNQALMSSALALNLIKAENRRFAQESLALRPAPTDNEIAEADAAVKRILPGGEVLEMVRKPTFVLMTLYATLAIYVCLPALIAALAFRGRLILLATGVTFVRRDGTPASRGRLFWRAVVAWSPLLSAIVLSAVAAAQKSPACMALSLGVVVGLALLSIALPQRGLQDRLAGTWPVPR